ncbi:MAG: RagB/SusD family nutrient uptake outer membrane protein [Dysgonamonadaceae bacterium]|jgi:hypothetical protein|nr:RagB/SusD family nutrient uptake outer membrane protein [Dysgonamonadaceae bacterium]
MIRNAKIKIGTVACLILTATLMFTSCEERILDLSPVHALSDETAYESPERCELAVIGAYDAAQCGYYETSDAYTRGYPFGAASIMQGEMRGEDMVNTAAFYDFTYSTTYDLTTANNKSYWEASFEAINRYNVVLEGIASATENGVLTQTQGDEYRAELLFLRALTYHSLLIHFALPYGVEGNNNYGLPIYTKAINTKERVEEARKIGRATVDETYKQALDDLDEAENLFSTNDLHKVNGITRASKGSVIALKTRVYLHKRDWNKVKEEASKIVGETTAPFTSPIGGYALTASPADPFTSYSNNTESVFSIENSATDEGSVNGAMAAMMSARSGGRALVAFSPILYNNTTYWSTNDKRRSLLIYSASTDYWYCDKYQRVTTREEYAPIIRYAEVLLNYAEAELRREGGNEALALELLNAVRNRALENPSTEAYTTASFADKKAFVDAILWERRIEFFGEGRRWEDIHRLAADDISPSGGIPKKIDFSSSTKKGAFVLGEEPKEEFFKSSRPFIPYTDKRFLWPIPINDVVRNPTLAVQQNAGW